MGLSNFLSINMPYGISRNEKGEWFAFNREYLPIGWNSIWYNRKSIRDENVYSEIPIYTKYRGLTEPKLLKLANGEKIEFDEKGRINRIFFYNGRTNPFSNPKNWNEYFEKLKILGTLKRKV